MNRDNGDRSETLCSLEVTSYVRTMHIILWVSRHTALTAVNDQDLLLFFSSTDKYLVMFRSSCWQMLHWLSDIRKTKNHCVIIWNRTISVITSNCNNNIFIVVSHSYGIHTDINISTSMDTNMGMSMYTSISTEASSSSSSSSSSSPSSSSSSSW